MTREVTKQEMRYFLMEFDNAVLCGDITIRTDYKPDPSLYKVFQNRKCIFYIKLLEKCKGIILLKPKQKEIDEEW